MSKEARQARRKARRENRQKRRQELKSLIDNAKNFTLPDSGEVEDAVEKFDHYWPLLKQGLQFAESLRITGDRADAKLNAIIEAGDKLAANPDLASQIDDFITKLKDYWTKVRTVLILVTRLTPDNVDEAIDKIIAIGDSITDYQ